MAKEEITKEDAIHCLTSFVEIRKNYCDGQVWKDEIQCLEMAIEAMKQQPCEDCISRKAVLEIIERKEFKGDALSEIEKLSSVTPQPKMRRKQKCI